MLSKRRGSHLGETVGALLLLGAAVPWLLLLAVLLLAAGAAGTLGSLLGLGGGVVLVPVLVLVFGLDIHLAVAASLVSVIATSTGAASTQVEGGFTDVRLGMFLEVATAAGGLAGALAAVTVFAARGSVLILTFVPVVLAGAVYMIAGRSVDVRPELGSDRLARRFRLRGECPDPEHGGSLRYEATRTGPGLAVSALAGVASGLLGIGGGIFKVPAMNAVMNVPMRVASATSTFMIGVTASAAAVVYLFAGDVALFVAAPAAVGAVLGSRAGSHLRIRVSPGALKAGFAVVLIGAAASMLGQGLGVFP